MSKFLIVLAAACYIVSLLLLTYSIVLGDPETVIKLSRYGMACIPAGAIFLILAGLVWRENG